MAPNKWITAFCTLLLLLGWQFSNAQCTFLHFTLSPSSAVCGTSTHVVMDSSQNSSYKYQLSIGGTNVGSPVYGNTGPIDFGSVTTGGTTLVTATIFGSSCTPVVVASTYINFTSGPPSGGSIASAGGATLICPGAPITLTFTPPDDQAYTYQWDLNGTPISGATAVTYSASAAGTYSMVVSNACASETVPGPTMTVGAAPGAPGPVSGNTNFQTEVNVGANFTVTPASGATGYTWSLSDPSAGSMTSFGTTGNFFWNTGYSGTLTINATAVGQCGLTTPATGLTVTVHPAVTPGTIISGTQSIPYNTIPAMLKANPTTGGNGTYIYQWLSSSSYSGTYNPVTGGSGATTVNYQPPALTATTYYQLRSSSNGVTVYSAIVTVTVAAPPNLVAGRLTPLTQTVTFGNTPGMLTLTGTAGGVGGYTYQWQQAPDHTTFTPVSGPTGTTYTPPNTLTATIYYRVAVTSGTAPTAYSDTVAVVIYNPAILASVPTDTMNYVISNTFRTAGITSVTNAQVAAMTVNNVDQSIQYMDGLGRPVQTVQVKASPAVNDMVAPQAYDQYGREVTKYLSYTPVSGVPGGYRTNAVSTDQSAFYAGPPAGVSVIANPYAQTNFDNSPLNRTVEQGAPGIPWQLSTSGITGSGHTVKMVYTLNNSTSFATDSINGRQAAMYYTVINSDNSQTLHNDGYYPASTLTVTVSKDENWTTGRAGTVEEYKDIDDHVVLKRVYNYVGTTVQMLSTYYVYDDLGRLAFVLPPLSGADGAGTISTTTLNNYCYQYGYDERGRQVTKQLPGKGVEETVYNLMDQPIFNRDANEEAAEQWGYTKYDAMGRVIMTGVENLNTSTRAALQSYVNSELAISAFTQWETPVASGGVQGYTNTAFPNSVNVVPLTVSYFDSYSNAVSAPAGYSAPVGTNMSTIGELVASKTAILNTPANLLWSVHYYDYLGRSLKSYAQHYLGGVLNANNYDGISTTYDFTNAPITVTRQHFTSSSTTTPLVTIADSLVYDNEGRKQETWERLNNSTSQLLVHLDYNEIAQLLRKNLHGTGSSTGLPANVSLGTADAVASGVTKTVTATNSIVLGPNFSAASGSTFIAQIQAYLQTITYTYNERGWPLGSSAPLFAMQLYYNTGTNKQYNGNIAYQYWGTPGSLSNNYIYTYDKLNRLTSGISADNYKETSITYDLMGNISTLNRYQANTLIDELAYNYTNGNQLHTVVDASGTNTGLVNGTTTYGYDGNGNLLSNANTVNTGQNKSYIYNLLNLPQLVTLPTGTATYTYDATGNKLRKVDVLSGVTTTTDYINGIQYNNSTTTIGFIQTEEGKAVPNGTSYSYQYYLGDNLGNTRVMMDTKTGAAIAIQQDDYYPFGMEINRLLPSPKNEYLYNKKELQEELTQYDYGARFYDPVIGRWNTIDPKAEKARRFSSYVYADDNSIRFIDPDGMETKDDYKLLKNGDIKLVAKTDDKTDRIVKTDSKGNVKTNSKGEAKTAVGGIEKGILKDGINFEKNNNVIDVGGKGQATVAGVQDFALKLSDYVDKEIGGYELSNKGETDISHVVFGHYSGNDATTSYFGLNLSSRPDLVGNVDPKVSFHTHPSRFSEMERLNASDADRAKEVTDRQGGVEKFIILTPGGPIEY